MGGVYKSSFVLIGCMTQATTRTEQTSHAPPLMDKAFFGKDNCLTVQLRAGSCFFKWGRKVGDSWEWKSVKFSDVELGEIVGLLEGRVDEAKFYHSFNDESTQIWISRLDKSVVFKAGEYTKGLALGEQKVLEVLLTHTVWMMNLT